MQVVVMERDCRGSLGHTGREGHSGSAGEEITHLERFKGTEFWDEVLREGLEPVAWPSSRAGRTINFI